MVLLRVGSAHSHYHSAMQQLLPSAESADEHQRFLSLLAAAVDDKTFTKLVLAKPRAGEAGVGADAAAGPASRITIRPIMLRDQPHLNIVHTHATRDITKNLAVAEALAAIGDWVGHSFSHAYLFTATEEVQLLVSKKGQQTLRRTPLAGAAATPAQASAHDRPKHRFVDIDRPFLTALGVTDAQHRLVPAMARKWKQINKFIEVLDHALASTSLKDRPQLKVADFGSGKGYLTFALHDHLRHTLGLAAEVTGVELRDDMVALCNGAAGRLALQGLHFEQGDVSTRPPEAVDVMIALHACDTATDHAIHTGLRAGAQIIMCSPCCHKELRPQLLSPHPLRPILKHGVHLGQQAEMLTDGLRAMLLDACGYDTQVFEFVALEHTNKNKMILAVKRPSVSAADDQVWQQIREIKGFYGIRDQCLETLLLADRAVVA
ncbi:SAM-dependent methyltransferase [soil metagenome]